jgi:hypothetical protein
MACDSWQETLVAHLYGELDAEREQGMLAHLQSCAVCLESREQLSSTRRWLQQGAPAVPLAPRVLVLEPRRRGWIAGALLTGALSAAVVSGFAYLALPRADGHRSLVGDEAQAAKLADVARPPETDEIVRVFHDRIDSLNRRIDQLEQQGPEGSPAAGGAQVTLTANALQQELQRVERRFQRERIRDLEYMLRAVTATENRTDNWIHETREALQLIAMGQQGGISEH